jgi:hypothetical protein
MSIHEYSDAREAQQRTLCRATVLQVQSDGRVAVRCGCQPEASLCRIVTVSQGTTLLLAPDDTVIVLHGVTPDEGDLIMGRVGESIGPAPTVRQQETVPVPDTLVIEANQMLTLRVGGGSITIREDGKILIKGKDLVSHAQRMNRIKGGAVSIN